MNQQQSTVCTQLGIASVPIQPWAETYRPEDAFDSGTIFPDLNLPFYGKGNNARQTLSKDVNTK